MNEGIKKGEEKKNEEVELIECAAIDCTNTFEPFMNIKKYCSKQCRNRERSRQNREKRHSAGLCIQCGEENDNIDKGVLRCSKCSLASRKYYQKNKEKFQQHRKRYLLQKIKDSANERQGNKQAK